MNKREALWRCVREAAQSYEAPDHLSDESLRKIASFLCQGVAPYIEDQDVFKEGPHVEDT